MEKAVAGAAGTVQGREGGRGGDGVAIGGRRGLGHVGEDFEGGEKPDGYDGRRRALRREGGRRGGREGGR